MWISSQTEIYKKKAVQLDPLPDLPFATDVLLDDDGGLPYA